MKPISLIFFIGVAGCLAGLYAFGLNNELVFDDARLTDGTIFGQYGSLLQLKARALSYGSFVWIQNIFGEGWWKQRIFNIGLHVVTTFTLYVLVLDLLKCTLWEASTRNAPEFSSSLQTSARLGVTLWAFNPVAVYAVAYLIQRSILMATLFVVLACVTYVRGLTTGQRRWQLLAITCYVLAVASKEHAVAAIMLAVPLVIVVKRPSSKRVMIVAVAAGFVLAVLGAVLFSLYGSIVGSVFDEASRAFAAQLEQQRTGISQQLYPLSIINQAALFFRYGLMWALPFEGWMSIDIRPPFPLAFISWQLVGAAAWFGMLAGSAWLVVRRADRWGLVGLGFLMPCLMFITEFSTVWLQDPFVLYRSYLWSIAIPILLALPLVGHTSKKMYTVLVVVILYLVMLCLGRIDSMRSSKSVWTDAGAKIDLQADANVVGRWRPFTALGEIALEQGDYDAALRSFSQGELLGEPMGSARFNIGVSLQQLNQHDKALEHFAAAEAKGFTEAALYYQRGESQYALGRFAEAHGNFTQALNHPQAPEAAEFTRLRQAEAAVASQKYDEAIASYSLLIQRNPDKQRYKVGLSMALVGKKDYPAAMDILHQAIAQRPTGPAHYARALTYFYMGNPTASAKDLELAMRAEPNNPIYPALQRQLDAPKGNAATKP